MHNLEYCVICGLSADRFNTYARSGEGLTPALGRYLWNIRLCESLYPTMNCVEVGIRNCINRSFTAEYGDRWFDLPGLLGEKEIRSVDVAKHALAKARRPVTTQGVVAELSFGFWTTLLSRHHVSPDPANPKYLEPWPRLLKTAFPHIPKQQLTRGNIAGPLNRVRELRNRISHHEPIWHQSTLQTTYEEAQQLCRWLTPAMADLVATVDRFPDTYLAGSVIHHDSVAELAGWHVKSATDMGSRCHFAHEQLPAVLLDSR